MKVMLVEIGYRKYVVEPRDAILLLEIASRVIEVEQKHYKGELYR
ncbi:MAG TPA: hypothetical protein VN663_23045 [Ramlibacter sp.]|nr:hypothetical protein [Ramlibacter sp.]